MKHSEKLSAGFKGKQKKSLNKANKLEIKETADDKSIKIAEHNRDSSKIITMEIRFELVVMILAVTFKYVS